MKWNKCNTRTMCTYSGGHKSIIFASVRKSFTEEESSELELKG